MECVIKSIKHTGRRGERFSERTDGRYPLRIGRVINFNPSYLMKDRPFILDYVRDKDGNDLSDMYLRTSSVVDFQESDDKLVVETLNTIYEMAKC